MAARCNHRMGSPRISLRARDNCGSKRARDGDEIMDEIEEKLSYKLGPLAAWQWGVIGALGVVLWKRFHAQTSTDGTQTVTLTPNSAGGVTNPATSTGSIGSFVSQLGESFSNLSFTLPDGTTFTGAGGTPTNPTTPTTPAPAPSPTSTNPPVTPPVPPAPAPIVRIPPGVVIPNAHPSPTPDDSRHLAGWGSTPGSAPYLPAYTVTPYIPAFTGLPSATPTLR